MSFQRTYKTTFMVLACVILFGGCPIERLMPNLVADGVARLTVANISLLMLGIRQQNPSSPECDFFSVKLSSNATVSGGANQKGSITWVFRNCSFDFGTSTDLYSDELIAPAATQTRKVLVGNLSGKVKLSGQKTVYGYLTGDANLPIIPEGKDALRFKFTRVEPNYLKGQLAAQDKYLSMVDGDLSFDFDIHLAADDQYQLCQIPLPNTTVSNVRYNASRRRSHVNLILPGVFNAFDVQIPSSNFSAQRGVYDSHANSLSGNVMVWQNNQQVPSDNLGLDPTFKSEDYENAVKLTPKLAQPATYQCPADQFIAINTARLLIKNMGVAAQQIAFDDRCGFSALTVQSTPLEVVGVPPHRGKIKFGIGLKDHDACTLDTAGEALEYARNCLNTTTYVQGQTAFRGVQIIFGEREYYKHFTCSVFQFCYDSIIPRKPTDVSIDVLQATFVNYSAFDLEEGNTAPRAKLLIKSGEGMAHIQPILAPSKDDVCRFTSSSPIAIFSDVSFNNLKGVLELNLKDKPSDPDQIVRLNVEVGDSNLSAQNGVYQGRGNTLSGYIEVNSKSFDLVRSDGSALDLDPSYDQSDFDLGYACRATCNPLFDGKKCFNPIAGVIPFEAGWDPNVGQCALKP
jgi:hypothetical protein